MANFRNIIRKILIVVFPKREIRRTYYHVWGELPNLVKPCNWIEKMYWLSLNSDTTLWTVCTDKYEMRTYVEDCGLVDLLPQNYGKWENAYDIPFNDLPSEYVLKVNHSTETCIFVREADNVNHEDVRSTLNRWIKTKYGYDGCQFHYLNIKPAVIAEEMLKPDELQMSISPKSLIDYKFYCCSGKPVCVWIAYNRDHSTGVDMSIYDLNWEKHPEWLKDMQHYHYSPVDIPRPKCLSDMIRYCEILSSKFPEVRIDFYIINDTPYIGELTFTSGYGFFTLEFYKYLGEQVNIDNVKIKRKNILDRFKLLFL